MPMAFQYYNYTAFPSIDHKLSNDNIEMNYKPYGQIDGDDDKSNSIKSYTQFQWSVVDVIGALW